MRKILAAIAVGIGLTGIAAAQDAVPSTPPWQAASPWPDRIVVTVERDPRTSFSVSWRTDESAEITRAEIASAAARSRFDLGGATVSVQATSETVAPYTKWVRGEERELRWNRELDPARYHSVTFDGLEPDTLYAYRVSGAEGHWSEWFQTRTGPLPGQPIKFLYFGDAQDGVLSHWARVVRAAYTRAPDARFAIHAGDLINFASRDFEWAEWFRSVSFIHGMIPAVPLPGNHEYLDLAAGSRDRLISLSVLWRPQFTLPQDPALPEAVRETAYAQDYGDLLVVALDTMASAHIEAQAEWLDGLLAGSDQRWKIVATHFPFFESADRDNSGSSDLRREVLLPVVERHDVDLVLQGHDHMYARGATGAATSGFSVFSRDRVETVFVTSSAGPKGYQMRPTEWTEYSDFDVSLQMQAQNTPLFQVIEIDGDSLLFEAYTATGELYDAFRLNKSDGRLNEIVRIPTDFAEPRTWDNTGEYANEDLDVLPPKPMTSIDTGE